MKENFFDAKIDYRWRHLKDIVAQKALFIENKNTFFEDQNQSLKLHFFAFSELQSVRLFLYYIKMRPSIFHFYI
jgi:hypothetical protein